MEELGNMGRMFDLNGFFLEDDAEFDKSEFYANSLANYYDELTDSLSNSESQQPN